MRQSEKLRQIGLGVQLRKLREEAEMTTRSVADSLGISASSITRNELGHRAPKREEVSALCALYGVKGEDKQALIEKVGTTKETAGWLATGYVPDQLASLMVLEREAVSITYVEVALIPGLAQTADYIRQMFVTSNSDEADLERRVTTRLGRQSILSRPRGPKVTLLIEEGALHRTLGNSLAMQEQLEHLITLQRRTNVSIRVVPFDASPRPANGTPFSLYKLADSSTYAFAEAGKLGVFVTEPTEVKPFVELCQAVNKCALDEQSSNALIRKIAEGLDNE